MELLFSSDKASKHGKRYHYNVFLINSPWASKDECKILSCSEKTHEKIQAALKGGRRRLIMSKKTDGNEVSYDVLPQLEFEE